MSACGLDEGLKVAGLSHSIKNIAGGLKGGAFVLEKGIELADMAYLNRGWQMIKGNVDRITRLSMDLLNFAKTADLNYRCCDPNQPAVEVVDLLKSRAEKKNIRLRLRLAADVRPFQFDPEGIHQCLLNLVGNGIEACECRSGDHVEKCVEIDTIQSPDGGVEYRVRDNGCGMSTDTQRRLFHDFFTTKGIRGTGIGLMMTRNIVDKHRGVIDIASTENAGTTVSIKLPDPAQFDAF